MSRGPAPKPEAQRRRRNVPVRGEWSATPGQGWQHGPVPTPPDGLMPASVTAWATWMGSWVAAHWSEMDLPGLRQLIRLYDQVERGEFVRSTEVRLGMDTYGLTPKGQQDRRWTAPANESAPAVPQPDASPATRPSRYAHLREVAS